MKRIATLFMTIAAAAVLGAYAHGGGHGCPGCPTARPGAEKAQPSPAKIYWCNCGPACKCNSVATKPGQCTCGNEMAGGHVVWVEGNAALACASAAG